MQCLASVDCAGFGVKRQRMVWSSHKLALTTFRFGSLGSRSHGKTGTRSSLLCRAAQSAIAKTLTMRSMQGGRRPGNGWMAARFHGRRGPSTMPCRCHRHSEDRPVLPPAMQRSLPVAGAGPSHADRQQGVLQPCFLAGRRCRNERRGVDPWLCFSSVSPLGGPTDSALFGPVLVAIDNTVS